VTGPKARVVRLPRIFAAGLRAVLRWPTVQARSSQRSRIVLLAAEGRSNSEIARLIGVTDKTVRKWRGRVADRKQIQSLQDAPRSGRPPLITLAIRCEVIRLACDRPEGCKIPFRDRWTVGSLRQCVADQIGWQLSETEIRRILHDEQLRPHRVRMWLHSPDPDFRRKVRAVCNLYCNPPKRATVLCIDEKTGMQALERAYPFRPALPGRDGRAEFEYARHGTRTLIAAFDTQTGHVFAHCRQKRREKDLMRFMEALAKRYPTGRVYVVWDNLNIHHGERWKKFNRRHRGRFRFVHTPLHASWVNQVEIWFSILQRRVLKHGSFVSAAELTARVLGFVRHWNRHEAHPFRWTFRGRRWSVGQRAA
jgi:transposase